MGNTSKKQVGDVKILVALLGLIVEWVGRDGCFIVK